MGNFILQLKKMFLSSNLLRTSGTYGLFSLLNSALPFFLMPILTRFLSPSDYGYVSLFNILLSFFTAVVGCNIPGAYSRAYFASDRFEVNEYWITALKLIFTIGVIVTLIVIMARNILQYLFKFPVNWLWLISVTATAASINALVLAHLQVRMMASQYGIYINMRTIVQALLSVLLVTVIHFNWRGQILAVSFAHVLFASIGVVIILYQLKQRHSIDKIYDLRFNMKYAQHALIFGIPLIPHALSGILNSTINRIFISQMIGVAETGIFTVGYQIGSIILLLATSFNQAYAPWLFGQLNTATSLTKHKIVKLVYIYFGVIILIALFLSILMPKFAQFFLGKNFYGAYVYVIWVAIGFAFTGMYYMVVNFIFYAEKTSYLTVITTAMCFINVLLNYVLIKSNGAIGAAQATTLTSIIYFFVVWYISSKVYPMPWLLRKQNDE